MPFNPPAADTAPPGAALAPGIDWRKTDRAVGTPVCCHTLRAHRPPGLRRRPAPGQRLNQVSSAVRSHSATCFSAASLAMP